MKRSIYVLLFILISTSSYAYRLISEKHTQSPSVKSSWIETKESTSSMLPYHVSAYASVGDANGKLNQYIDLLGHHFVSIQNISNTKKRYKYGFFLSCGNATSSHEFEIELGPYESHYKEANHHVTFQSEYLGDFTSTASTTISGAESYEFTNHGNVGIHNK